MKFTTCLLLLTAPATLAFTHRTTTRPEIINTAAFSFTRKSPSSSTTEKRKLTFVVNSKEDVDDEIERLKSMAAKLRSEAAALEAERLQEMAEAAQRAFEKFDTNRDGKISVDELKIGLEKELKTELSDSRVKELLKAFDKTGSGVLQPDEFVTVDRFKNKLGELVREERELAAQAKREAELESEKAKIAEAVLEVLNNRPPTNTDKLLSIIPYLFPLLDGLQYGRFLFEAEQSNPLVVIVALLYTLYRTIPFSGFVSFLALSFLSGNFRINRLIRFNMQQAIYIDIALFFPGLISGLFNLALGQAGTTLPASFTEITTDAVFITLLLTLTYCIASSLFGAEPDKIPLISGEVKKRLPTIEMFDEEGRFIPPTFEKKDEGDNKKKDEDDNKKK